MIQKFAANFGIKARRAVRARASATQPPRPLCNGLYLGVGCKRGVSAEALCGFIAEQFRRAGLAMASAHCLATVDIKRDEAGLVGAAVALGLPLLFFSAAELEQFSEAPGRPVIESAIEPALESPIEPALVRAGWPKGGFSAPSAKVREVLGLDGVCEQAAWLAGCRDMMAEAVLSTSPGTLRMALYKVKKDGMTLAVAARFSHCRPLELG